MTGRANTRTVLAAAITSITVISSVPAVVHADGPGGTPTDSANWPVLSVVGALTTSTVAITFWLTSRSRRRTTAPAQLLAASIMTTAMAATSTAIDRIDATSTDRFTTVAVGIAVTATFVTVAALCRQARRGTIATYTRLTAASIVLMLVHGAKNLATLGEPPTDRALPHALHRIAVALAYTTVIPAGLALVIAARRHARELRRQPHHGTPGQVISGQ